MELSESHRLFSPIASSYNLKKWFLDKFFHFWSLFRAYLFSKLRQEIEIGYIDLVKLLCVFFESFQFSTPLTPTGGFFGFLSFVTSTFPLVISWEVEICYVGLVVVLKVPFWRFRYLFQYLLLSLPSLKKNILLGKSDSKSNALR